MHSNTKSFSRGQEHVTKIAEIFSNISVIVKNFNVAIFMQSKKRNCCTVFRLEILVSVINQIIYVY